MFHFNKDCFRVQYSRKGTLLSENQLLKCSWTDGWIQATNLGPATDHWQVSLAKCSVFCSYSQLSVLSHISIIYGKQVKYNRRCPPVSHYFLSLHRGDEPHAKRTGTFVLARMEWAALCSNMAFTRKGYISLHCCNLWGSILCRSWINAGLTVSLKQRVTPSAFPFYCGKWARGSLFAVKFISTKSDFHILSWLICT